MAAVTEAAKRLLLRREQPSERPRLPPGPSWPAPAQLAAWIYFSFPFLERCRARYGSPFSMRFPAWPSIVVFDDPEAIREVFTGPHEHMHAGQANEPLRPVVGPRSLLLLDGERHLRERRLLLPPFHGARMHRYGEVMREITERDLARWPLGRTFTVQPRTQAITLDIILRTVFGVDEGERLERLRASVSRLIDQFSSPSSIVPWLQVDLGPRSPWGRYLRHRDETDALLHEQIEQRRREGTEGRDDILTMLLEARYEDGAPLSRDELRDELMTLLAAGHETTATALAWTFHHLARHPHVQARVHEELDRVVGEGPVDPEGSSALVYLDAVIKETLRLRPVVAGIGRVLRAPMTIGGWDLPAGTMVGPSIYLTHRNPKVWPDPTRFDPERFLVRKVGPYEFLPFGGGTRRCIGMAFALYEMRIVLATVLARHRVLPAPGSRIRPARRSVTMAPSDDMPIVLERR